jgi:Bacterial regulatory proteins, luxR family
VTNGQAKPKKQNSGPRANAKTPTLAGDLPDAAAIEGRRRQVLDLVVAGESHHAIADRFGISVSTVSVDYRKAMALYYGPTAEAAEALRAEITLRQRSVIAGSIEAARDGDAKAAAVISRADSLIADVWGLKSLGVREVVTTEDDLQVKLDAYLAGIADAVR